eukprot:30980-Pelagococcus_subviridis.AAC.44
MSHRNPSSIPTPVSAEHAPMCHALPSPAAPIRSTARAMSDAPSAVGTSLLFANTNSGRLASSSRRNIPRNIFSLSRSTSSPPVASTTKTTAWHSL